MTDYKRLNFENPKGGEDQRSQRFFKGLGRELATPTGSIPYSTEGTSIPANVDRPIVTGAVKNRNELTRVIEEFSPLVKLKKAKLTFEKNTFLMVQEATIEFDKNSTEITPRVSP